MREIFVSVDIEATGPIPGLTEYSMFELGACLVDDPSKKFFTKIQLPNDNFIPKALAACRKRLADLKKAKTEPDLAMRLLEQWLLDNAQDGRPVFVGFNAPFDWSFVNWYFHKFLGRNPFGISGLDVKAYYMGKFGLSWGETAKNRIPPAFQSGHPHTHNALDDAIEQAEVFRKIRDARLQRP